MNSSTTNSPLDQAINSAFSKLRDVSLRDGIQSWDGNKWPIDEITPVAEELNELIKLGKKRGIDMPPAEVWGGGQVVQPAMFMGEDPLKNLEALHQAMPDTDMQLVYRGRQGFGFEPLSAEIQEKAIEAAAQRGAKIFRIFDMMNDVENVQPGFTAMNAYKDKHGKDSIVVEGAISYISTPEKGDDFRAMTLKEYGQYAVELAKLGSDEIVIKNYSGAGDKEMPDLIKAIRSELDDAGYKSMKINLHVHGQKPDVVMAAIEAGADKVDVAVGLLSRDPNHSNTPSHTNMRDAVYRLLEEQGIDVNNSTTQIAINHNPMMRQLKKVEDAIEAVVMKERPGKNGQTTTFKKGRAVLEKFSQEDADRYHMASGALSDLAGRIQKDYEGLSKTFEGKKQTARERAEKGLVSPGDEIILKNNFPDRDTFFKQVLETGVELWEKAGQFNTVTPGAKILIDQAIPLTAAKIEGKKVTLDMYQREFVDIAAGRFGRNRGMEKGLGDTKWLDSVMMHRALKLVNEGLRDARISEKDMGNLAMDAAFGSKGHGNRLVLKSTDGRKQIDLKDPDLETKLNASDINRFRSAVEKAGFDAAMKERVLNELTIGRSPEPIKGMEDGRTLIRDLSKQGTDIALLHSSGHRISSEEDMALLSMLLPSKAFTHMLSSIMNNGPESEQQAVKDEIRTITALVEAEKQRLAARQNSGRLH